MLVVLRFAQAKITLAHGKMRGSIHALGLGKKPAAAQQNSEARLRSQASQRKVLPCCTACTVLPHRIVRAVLCRAASCRAALCCGARRSQAKLHMQARECQVCWRGVETTGH